MPPAALTEPLQPTVVGQPSHTPPSKGTLKPTPTQQGHPQPSTKCTCGPRGGAARARLQPILGSLLVIHDRTASVGLALHCADILLEELREAALPRPVPAAAWDLVSQPAVQGLRCPSLALCSRIQ